jgi:hypothetical protein
MTPLILGYFDSAEDMFKQFSDHTYNYTTHEYDYDMIDTEGVEILLSHYEAGGYEGSAFVLFRKDGKLYEVNASHCSCYGLEGQWSPEETTIAALRHRMSEGSLGREYSYGQSKGANIFAEELTKILYELEMEGYQ